MICPVCKKDMLVVEYNQVEVDFCPSCQGVWFDSGELELLLSSVVQPEAEADLSQQFSPAAAVKEKPRKCSLCQKRMEKVIFGSKPGVLIDRCSNGDGLWFDGGELRQVLDEFKGGDSKTADVLSFLKDTLSPNHKQGGK